MKTYIGVLGGTGFRSHPRFSTAMRLAIDNPDAKIVTSGLGFREYGDPGPNKLVDTIQWAVPATNKNVVTANGRYERQFQADFLEEHGIPRSLILVGKGGDEVHRNTADDIRQMINAIQWTSEPTELIFPTEGLLHALRVKEYALCQVPEGCCVKVLCVETGERLTLERRFREVVSFLKFLRWRNAHR